MFCVAFVIIFKLNEKKRGRFRHGNNGRYLTDRVGKMKNFPDITLTYNNLSMKSRTQCAVCLVSDDKSKCSRGNVIQQILTRVFVNTT